MIIKKETAIGILMNTRAREEGYPPRKVLDFEIPIMFIRTLENDPELQTQEARTQADGALKAISTHISELDELAQNKGHAFGGSLGGFYGFTWHFDKKTIEILAGMSWEEAQRRKSVVERPSRGRQHD
jgi:hypothetical protein